MSKAVLSALKIIRIVLYKEKLSYIDWWFRQFLTKFSQTDWFSDVLKIRTDARQWCLCKKWRLWELSKNNKQQWFSVLSTVLELSRIVSNNVRTWDYGELQITFSDDVHDINSKSYKVIGFSNRNN